MADTGYRWHLASDGMATFPQRDGGFVLVSNSEAFEGGASAIRFDRDGRIEDAHRILSGTTQNCSGGGTPVGHLALVRGGRARARLGVRPQRPRAARCRTPRMGVFKHEAAAVDPRARRVYLTEDLIDGGLYRYTPERWPDLSAGRLEIARVGRAGSVEWVEVPDPLARRERTRRQVPGSARLERGEGIWLDGETLWVATTADHRVHAYDTRRERIRVAYDGLASRSAPLLRVDQLTGSRAGEVFVCEDLATDEIDVGVIAPDRTVSKFLSVTGPQHVRSELTGVTFDPSGKRMFVASQRALPAERRRSRPRRDLRGERAVQGRRGQAPTHLILAPARLGVDRRVAAPRSRSSAVALGSHHALDIRGAVVDGAATSSSSAAVASSWSSRDSSWARCESSSRRRSRSSSRTDSRSAVESSAGRAGAASSASGGGGWRTSSASSRAISPTQRLPARSVRRPARHERAAALLPLEQSLGFEPRIDRPHRVHVHARGGGGVAKARQPVARAQAPVLHQPAKLPHQLSAHRHLAVALHTELEVHEQQPSELC